MRRSTKNPKKQGKAEEARDFQRASGRETREKNHRVILPMGAKKKAIAGRGRIGTEVQIEIGWVLKHPVAILALVLEENFGKLYDMDSGYGDDFATN